MTAKCVTSRTPWHVMLVLDDSDSMSGQPSQDLNEALKEFIEALNTLSMAQKPYFKVSVISFGSNYHTIAEAVSEQDLDENQVASFQGGSGSTNAAAGLDEAARILRKNPGAATDFEPFVYFFSDGHPDSASEALKAADEIKNLSLTSGTPTIVTLGFGNVDDNFMRSLATDNELYKKMSSSEDFKVLLPNIGSIPVSNTEGKEGIKEQIKEALRRRV